jgi:MFS transporter, PCFT/HCP family, solute carrier family 46, member 3
MPAVSESSKPVVAIPPTESRIRRLLKLITIEPLVICWLLPFLLTYAAVENLNIEKACRGFAHDFDKDICKIFVRKDTFDIECDESNNITSIETIKINDIKATYPAVYESIKDNIEGAMNFLCQTEEIVQQKLSGINAIRNPIAAIGPLIIILFAGPWSDKKNLRVPCMIVPFLGEMIGFICKTS